MNHHGGSIKAIAGEAHGESQNGGEIEISAGNASHRTSGRGGSIRISGGHAAGRFKKDGLKDGGDIQIVSGSSTKGLSGSVLVQSGFSEAASTGEIGEVKCKFRTHCQKEFHVLIYIVVI